MSIQQFHQCELGAPYTLPNNMTVWSWSIPFVAEKVVEIFLEIIKETREIVDDQLTYDEQLRFDKILQAPEVQKLLAREPVYIKEDLLTSQLEMVLQKTQSEKRQSEQIIRGVSLHDSILDLEVVEQVGNQGISDSQFYGNQGIPANPNVFNYVRTFDLHNEKRPDQRK